MTDASSDTEARAAQWIAAWNSRDLERILALYSDDAVMSSEKIRRLGLAESGVLKGKPALRAYWSLGLSRRPTLQFTPIETYASPDSLVLHYRDDLGHVVCEFLRYGADGRIVQGAAHHSAHGA